MGKIKRTFSPDEIQKTTSCFFIYRGYLLSRCELVIEIDGSIHELDEVKNKDKVRQMDLEKLGLKVIRFTTNEILNNLESVLERIENNLK